MLIGSASLAYAQPENAVFGLGAAAGSVLWFCALGVAMANAHPDLLAAADLVTTTNDDDGVARVIERLLDGSLDG